MYTQELVDAGAVKADQLFEGLFGGAEAFTDMVTTALLHSNILEKIQRAQQLHDRPVRELLDAIDARSIPCAACGDAECSWPFEDWTKFSASDESSHGQILRFLVSKTMRDCSVLLSFNQIDPSLVIR